MGIVLEDVLVAGFNTSDAPSDGGAGRDVLVGGLGGDNLDAGGGKSEFGEFSIVKTTDGTLPDGTDARSGMQQTEQGVSGMFAAPAAAADGSKGGNVEFEWKVEEGESSGDVFGFTAMDTSAATSGRQLQGFVVEFDRPIDPAGTHLPSVTDMVIDSFDTGRLLIGNGGDGGWLFGDGGDGASAAAGWGGLHYRYGEDDLASFQADTTGGHVGGAGGLFFGTGGAGGDGIPVTMAEYGLMIA
jgi:hypothetical protein